MKVRRRWARWSLLGIIPALLIGPPVPARAACPPNPCDCLGEARRFNLVASKRLTIQQATLRYYHYSYLIEAYVEGDGCSPQIFASGPAGHPTAVFDLIAPSGPGSSAVRFATRVPPGYYFDPGVEAETVATLGAGVVGQEHVSATAIDTTGTYSKLTSCQQALVDMRSAATALAGMTPTQDLGVYSLRGEYGDLYAEPGVNVWQADRIALRPRSYYGYKQRASLWIDLDPATEAVIINTSTLTLGENCAIDSSDPTKVILNVVGPGGRVKVGKYGYVGMPILAPDRDAVIGLAQGDFSIGNLYANRITLRGSTAFSGLAACP